MFTFVTVVAFMLGQAPAAAPVFIHVDAPAAQRLIVAEKTKHSEIGKLGLHAVPPSATDNAIIASDNPAKIGKLSSANDIRNLATGKPFAVRIDKDKIFDLLLPITDASGHAIHGGFVVMEVPFANATDEQQALRIGIAIRDEIQSQIPSQSALYQR